jgi:hypothetical protein
MEFMQYLIMQQPNGSFFFGSQGIKQPLPTFNKKTVVDAKLSSENENEGDLKGGQ